MGRAGQRSWPAAGRGPCQRVGLIGSVMALVVGVIGISPGQSQVPASLPPPPTVVEVGDSLTGRLAPSTEPTTGPVSVPGVGGTGGAPASALPGSRGNMIRPMVEADLGLYDEPPYDPTWPYRQAALTQPVPIRLPDTALYYEGRNLRLGFNAFLISNRVATVWHGPRGGVAGGSLAQEALYNKDGAALQGLGGGSRPWLGGRLIQQNYFWRTGSLSPLRAGGRGSLWAGHEMAGALFEANGVRIASGHGVLRYGAPGPASGNLLSPGRLLIVDLLAGGAYDARGAVHNAGPSAGVRVMTAGPAGPRADSALQWQGQAGARVDRLGPRQQGVVYGQGALRRLIGEAALMQLTLEGRTRRTEDYLPGLIQQVRSDTLSAGLELSTRVGQRGFFRSINRILLPDRAFGYRPFADALGARPNPDPMATQGGAVRRQSNFYRQRELRARQELGVRTGPVAHLGALELGQRVRTYGLRNTLDLDERTLERALTAERAKDIDEYTVMWYYQARWQAGRRDALTVTGVSQLFRLSTPSEINDQDRDEAFYSGEVSWRHAWARGLATGWRLSASERQMVFITATQSSQNLTERVIRMEPEVVLAYGGLSWRASYGIWATYSERHYESEWDKNRANRVLIAAQQLHYRRGPWAARLEAQRRENRIALFDPRRFAESPLDTVTIYELHPRISRQLSLGRASESGPGPGTLELSGGYRLFAQRRRYVGAVTEQGMPPRAAALSRQTLQHGPWAAIVWWAGPRGQLSADGWWQWARDRGGYRLMTGPLPGLSTPAAELLARQRRRYFFFNLTGSLWW